MRFLVSADQAAGRVRADPHPNPAAGADHDHRLCPMASGLLLPTRRAEDLYAGWWRLLEQLGAAPRVLVWDGETAVGRWRPRQPELTLPARGSVGC
jgi:hypothetical protein